MQILYSPIANKQKNQFVRDCIRGHEIVLAIEKDLSHDPIGRAINLKENLYAQIFTPEINPQVEIRLSYLVGEKILIKVFKWV